MGSKFKLLKASFRKIDSRRGLETYVTEVVNLEDLQIHDRVELFQDLLGVSRTTDKDTILEKLKELIS